MAGELMVIDSKKKLLQAIRRCKGVYVLPRFGLNEDRYVRISKAEAIAFASQLPDDATPTSIGIYGNKSFGSINGDGCLDLG